MSDASLPEQLLSAFVDGQLSGAEKKRAEKLIANNPHYAEMVEQWRAQGQMIHELPRYRLDRDLTETILAKIELDRSVASPGVSQIGSGTDSWDVRSAGAAILALAAMILLTLFVIPTAPSNTELAFKRDSLSEKGDTPPSSKQGPEESVSAEKRFRSGAGAKASEKLAEDSRFQLGADETVEPSADREMDLEPMKLSDSAESGIAQFKSRRAYDDQVQTDGDDGAARLESDLAQARPLGEKTELLEEADSELSEFANKQPAPLPEQIAESTDSKKLDQIAAVIPTQNVDEVWFVDMQGQKPLEKLHLALRQNQIQFEAGKNEGQVARSSQSSNMEAVYVVTSNSQIRNAIAMLTNDADIVSYTIPKDPQTRNDVANTAIPNVALENEKENLELAPATESNSSLAQQIQEDLYLPKDSDHSLKMNRLFFGTVIADKTMGSKLVPKPASDPVAPQRQSQADAAKPSKRLAKSLPAPNASAGAERGNPSFQLESNAQDEDNWHEEEVARREAQRLRDGAMAGQSRQVSPAPTQEEMKRFLLLIRFDGQSELVEPATASEEQDNQ